MYRIFFIVTSSCVVIIYYTTIDVAEMVFDKCISGNGLPIEHPSYQIFCSYEFLEDSFVEWGSKLVNRDTDTDVDNYENEQVTYYDNVVHPVISPSATFFQRVVKGLRLMNYVKERSEGKRNHVLKLLVSAAYE